MAINAVAGAGAASSLASSRSTIADNFDTFLSLLTTQLKNQNPLDPLDTNQFTSQMVEFTSVEQQLKSNEFLEALVLSNQSSTYTDAVNFVGKDVTAAGSTTQLQNGEAKWSFTVAESAPDVNVTVTDQNGNTVYTAETSVNAGEGQFVWDGIDSTGNQLPEGKYTVTIDARDADGAYVPVSTKLSGTVSAVDLSGSEPVLIVDGNRVNLSAILSVGVAA